MPVEDVVLIASELVTNAVRAGAAWVDLTLKVTRQRLDLVVADDAHGWPVLVTADEEAIGGRGLRLGRPAGRCLGGHPPGAREAGHRHLAGQGLGKAAHDQRRVGVVGVEVEGASQEAPRQVGVAVT